MTEYPPTKPYKAVVALLLAFLTAMIASVSGREDLDTLDALQWAVIIGAAVVTAGAVYQVPNPPDRP